MVNAVYHLSAAVVLSKLASGSIGAIITDPPATGAIHRIEVSQEGYRVMRKGGSMVLIGHPATLVPWDAALTRAGFVWMSAMAVLWDTANPRARNFGSLYSQIWWYIKPGARHSFNSGDVRSIHSNVLVARKVPVNDRLHPAQKPVELTNFLVSLLTDEGDTVVDPYCGCGTTLVSAIHCDRDWIGADIDEAAVNTARERVTNIMLGGAEAENPLHLWLNNKLIRIEA